MNAVFADTSYYAALFNRGDVNHAAALRLSEELADPVVTTEFVLLELGNAFCRLPTRRRYVGLVESLRGGLCDVIVPASHELFDGALRLFAERDDKEWSLTDCASFVVMRERGIVEALTADHHFEQAGFRILLK